MVQARRRCEHVPARTPQPRSGGCEVCNTDKNRRLCLTCGHVGCCESLEGHAKAHAESTGHHVIGVIPVTPVSFVWCYACKEYVFAPPDHPAAPENKVA